MAPMAKPKWKCGLIVGIILVSVLGGSACSSNDSKSSGTEESNSSIPDDQGESTVTIGIICTSAQEATETTVNAWEASDKAAASRCSEDVVVESLFSTSGAKAEWVFQGCVGINASTEKCAFTYGGGAALFTAIGSDAMGWKLSELSFQAD